MSHRGASRRGLARALIGIGDTPDGSWARGERGRIALVGGLVVGAALYPVRQQLRPIEQRVDGFPLSYYPMFSKRRKKTARMVYGVGVDAAGRRRYLTPAEMGSGGHNQIRHQLQRIAVVDKRAQEYVIELAAQLARLPAQDAVVRVQIVRGEFELDTCLLGRQVHGAETVLAEADVAPNTAVGSR